MKFEIIDKELESHQKWFEAHECNKPGKYYGAIGGHLTYEFTPNSIGCAIKVKCNVCAESADLTDYDIW